MDFDQILHKYSTPCLDKLLFEGREIKVKVATRSGVKKFGTPYLMNGLKDFVLNLIQNILRQLYELITFSRLCGQGQGRCKAKYLSDLLRRADRGIHIDARNMTSEEKDH